MTGAVQTIRLEHFNIASVLTCLAHLLGEAEAGRWAPEERLLSAVLQYLESYPEVYHHPKEDDYLFAAMRRRQPDLAETLDRVHDEHVEGDRLLRGLRASLSAYFAGEGEFEDFRRKAMDYIAFERRHMQREERELLPLALRILEPEDWRAIDEAFAANRDPLFGDARRREFKDLVDWILELAPSPLGFAEPARPAPRRATGR
jgi:hemerythrin-like domain-containing protein